MACLNLASYKVKLELHCQIEKEKAVYNNNLETFMTIQ